MKLEHLYLTIKRLLHNSWYSTADAQRAVPQVLLKKLEDLIKTSETAHSGQIRLVVEAALPSSYIWRGLASRARAVMLFGKLRVWDTERNNGVLIYVLLAERKIEIVADRGLEQLVPRTVWTDTISQMRTKFIAKEFETGLALAIGDVAKQLIQHFPAIASQLNELPDAPIIQ